jgi:hypothetical protein
VDHAFKKGRAKVVKVVKSSRVQGLMGFEGRKRHILK